MEVLVIALIEFFLLAAVGTVLIVGLGVIGVYAAWWVLMLISVIVGWFAHHVAFRPRLAMRDPGCAAWLLCLLALVWLVAGITTYPEFFAALGHLFVRGVTR